MAAKTFPVEGDFSNPEAFWNTVTRQRMEEVGPELPFDVMVRGGFDRGVQDVSSILLGGESGSVETDLVNFDLDSCYMRLYDVDLRPESPLSGELSSLRMERIPEVVRGLENTWEYELTEIVYDPDHDFTLGSVEPVDGTVYWPGSEEYEPDSAYSDLCTLLGEDILSEL